jgi:uncharacterized repeat protein (TIGR01451 family)
MRRLAAAALTATVVAVLLTLAPSGSSGAEPAAGQARCRLVTKMVKGHRKRVRVCKPKPKAKPKPKPPADLLVRMSSSLDHVTAGNQVGYSVQVANRGPEAATDVSVTVDVPAEEVSFYGYGGSADVQCNSERIESRTQLRCSVGRLEAQAGAPEPGDAGPSSAFLFLVAEPEDAGSFVTESRVQSSLRDPQPEDNVARRELRVLPGPASADLHASISATPDPASVREGLTETVSVTNTGPSEATSVYATVLLPPGTRLVDAPQVDGQSEFVGLCPPYVISIAQTAAVCFDAVEAGQTRTTSLHLELDIRAPPALETDVSVSAYTKDPNLADNHASLTIAVAPFTPPAGVDLVATLTPPTSAVSGQPLALGIRVVNLGLADAHDVHVRFTTPSVPNFGSLFALVSGDLDNADVACSLAEGAFECNIPDFESGAGLTGVLVADAPAAGTLSVTATVTSSTDDATPADNTSTASFEVKPSQALR